MATNIRSNFGDLFGEGKLADLEAIIHALEGSYPSMISLLFNEEGMTTDISRHTTISGLRNPTIKPENGPIPYQTLKSGFSKTYSSDTWATGYRISKEMVDDGKYSFIKRATASFAKGMYEVKEIAAADVFNDGFTTNGYDAVPLFSTSHPLENGDGVLGVNIGTAAELSLTSFRELRNIVQDTLNEDGQRVVYKSRWLVLPQTLQDVGKEIVKSQYNPENANNAINTVYDSLNLLPGDCWQYLESDTAYFMVGDKNEHWLMFMNRKPLETDSDYEKMVAWKLMASCRFDVGYSNWRNVVGNAGA